MSIPALHSSPLVADFALGTSAPASVAQPASASRAVPESRLGSTPTVEAADDRSQIDKTKKAGEAAKDEQAAKKELEEAVAKLNEKLKPFIQEAVRFNVDQDSGRLVVAVVDTEKNTVIRQIPSQEALKMSRELNTNQQTGLLLNTQA